MASIYRIWLLFEHQPVFRGREWTGEYLLDFKDLITSNKPEIVSTKEEARFSFIRGGYVEDSCPQGTLYVLGSIFIVLPLCLSFLLWCAFVYFYYYYIIFPIVCPNRKWRTVRNITLAGWGNRKDSKYQKSEQWRDPLPRRSNDFNWLPQGTVLPWSQWRIWGSSTSFSTGGQDWEGSWLQPRENVECTMKVMSHH